jgi:hypothetical protein
VAIPEALAPGNYWVTVYADGPAPGVVAESNENNNIGSSTPNQITITAPLFTVATMASPSNAGTATGGGTYARGANVVVQASPISGYHFVGWTEGGTVVSTLPGYSFAAVAARSLTANFVADQTSYTITLSSSPGGAGAFSGAGTFPTGSSRIVTATANPGFAFAYWAENGGIVSTSTSYNFTLNANRNLVATFTGNSATYAVVTPTAGANGSISPNAPQTVNTGSSIAFTAIPASGYAVDQWLVNDAAVQGGGARFTLNNVAGDTSVHVSFVASPVPRLTGMPLANGQFQLTVFGEVGRNYALQASTNLQNWTSISNFPCIYWVMSLTDPAATNYGYRFYRLGPLTGATGARLGFSSAHPFTTNGLYLSLTGTVGINYRVDASTDLIHWAVLTNLVTTSSQTYFRDPAASNFRQRLYRAVAP